MLSLKDWSGDYASLDAEIRRRVEDRAVYTARVEGVLNDFEEPDAEKRAALGKHYLDYLGEWAEAKVEAMMDDTAVPKWPDLRPNEASLVLELDASPVHRDGSWEEPLAPPPDTRDPKFVPHMWEEHLDYDSAAVDRMTSEGGRDPEEDDEVRNWRHREAMPQMSADEKVELEGAITQCIREAVARTMAVTTRKPLPRAALVGEFCTQLRRTVQHWGHDDRRRLAVLQLCDTKYWDAPGILFPTAWPSVTFQQGISGTSQYAAQVVLEGSKVNQLAMNARGDATAEQVVLACIEEMRQNNLKADRILVDARVMEVENARTLQQLHDFAVKTEEDFTDAVEAQRRLMGLAAA